MEPDGSARVGGAMAYKLQLFLAALDLETGEQMVAACTSRLPTMTACARLLLEDARADAACVAGDEALGTVARGQVGLLEALVRDLEWLAEQGAAKREPPPLELVPRPGGVQQ